jgi:hypothetical protein
MRRIFSDQSAAIRRILEIRGLSGSGNGPRIERMSQVDADRSVTIRCIRPIRGLSDL